MTWTIHRGYLGDPQGLPIADKLIFVKHKDRSYEAVALYTGEHRNVYKKDKNKLFDYLSTPLVWSKDHVENFMHKNCHDCGNFCVKFSPTPNSVF